MIRIWKAERSTIISGFHELELAKTLWNAIASNEIQSRVEEKTIIDRIRLHLEGAERILSLVAKAEREEGWGIEVKQLSVVLAETVSQ